MKYLDNNSTEEDEAKLLISDYKAVRDAYQIHVNNFHKKNDELAQKITSIEQQLIKIYGHRQKQPSAHG